MTAAAPTAAEPPVPVSHPVREDFPRRSPAEIACMRRAGVVAHDALQRGLAACVPGATGFAVDAAVRAAIVSAGASPAFFRTPHPSGGAPFPASCCVCVGGVVTHGVPSGVPFVAGDLVTLDVGVRFPGVSGRAWCADTASCAVVGGDRAFSAMARLRQAAAAATSLAVQRMAPGVLWSDVAAETRSFVAGLGYGLLRGYGGHGVGSSVHEPPVLPWLGESGYDVRLAAGMTLAVEPLLVADAAGVGISSADVSAVVDSDGWSVRLVRAASSSVSGSAAAQSSAGMVGCFSEHTVVITDKGVRVLTLGADLSA